METSTATSRTVAIFGTIFIVVGCVLVLIDNSWAFAAAGVFAGVGVGLRIESAITNVGLRGGNG